MPASRLNGKGVVAGVVLGLFIGMITLGADKSRAPAAAPAPPQQQDLLTKHEGETFQNQTIYISGQAFVRCKFVACTLVLRESTYHLEGCTFERCNWHVDVLLRWGSSQMLDELKALVDLLEKAQRAQAAQEKAP